MLPTLLSAVAGLFRTRRDLILENLALRQQLTVLTRHRPRRRMPAGGRFFWVTLRGLWPVGERCISCTRRSAWVAVRSVESRTRTLTRFRLRKSDSSTVVFHERHLHRLLTEYVASYLDDRPHLALGKDAPSGRAVERPPRTDAEIVSFPRVGGLHHRYGWRVAA